MHVSSLLRDCKTKYLDCYPFAMSKSKSMLGTRELDVSRLVSSKIFLAIGFFCLVNYMKITLKFCLIAVCFKSSNDEHSTDLGACVCVFFSVSQKPNISPLKRKRMHFACKCHLMKILHQIISVVEYSSPDLATAVVFSFPVVAYTFL